MSTGRKRHVVSQVQPSVVGRLYFGKGPFNPDDPEILISGYGRLTLSRAKQKLRRELGSLADRTAGNGSGEFQSILHLIDCNSVIQTFSRAIYDVYTEMQTPQIKSKITRMRKMTKENKEIQTKPFSSDLTLVRSILEAATPNNASNIANQNPDYDQIGYTSEEYWKKDCVALRYHIVETKAGVRTAYKKGSEQDVAGREMGQFYLRGTEGYLYVPVEFEPTESQADPTLH